MSNKLHEIVIKILCENKDAREELDENLDEFIRVLDNIEGNVDGFSFKLSEKVTQRNKE